MPLEIVFDGIIQGRKFHLYFDTFSGSVSATQKGWDSMQLAQEVKTFSSACEHILSAISMNRLLTPEEASMIEYYCLEILAKIAPILPKPT